MVQKWLASIGRTGHAGARVPKACAPRRIKLCIRAYSQVSQKQSNGAIVSHETHLKTYLDRYSPRFNIHGSQIDILDSPAEFYATLKRKIRTARRRIFISTLYIGRDEHELIDEISSSLRQNRQLRVSILVDALRGLREAPDPSCASLLAPLLTKYPGQIEIRMFRSPNLVGLRGKLIPRRINEAWGTQHMKLYGFDDEVILSGANLSTDYFTNRQDRYHVFSSATVTEFYSQVHAAVCSLSFALQACPQQREEFELTWPTTNNAPDPTQLPDLFKIKASNHIESLLLKHRGSRSNQLDSQTCLYPTLTFEAGVQTEFLCLQSVLAAYGKIKTYTFTTGYFNPYPRIASLLLALSGLNRGSYCSPGRVLIASPFANGFYGSKGLSRLIPAAYTELTRRFVERAAGSQIAFREWRRGTNGEPNGWSFHAKGIWVTYRDRGENHSGSAAKDKKSMKQSPASTPASKSPSSPVAAGPSVVTIGSSNYSTRSYDRDVEAGALIVTTDPNLQKRYAREVQLLEKHTTPVDRAELNSDSRRPSWLALLAMWIANNFLKAL